MDRHDCEYVRSRNRLLPEAEDVANRVAGAEPPPPADGANDAHAAEVAREAWAANWTCAFHQAMERLVAARGISL